MSGRRLFATTFYHARGAAPGAFALRDLVRFRIPYRCMVVCYASLRRCHPGDQLVLFADHPPPEPFAGQLKALGVAWIRCEPAFERNGVIGNPFPGCLYALDAVRHLAAGSAFGFDRLVLLDNRCLLQKPLPPEDGSDPAIHAYATGLPVASPENGQSRASLTVAACAYAGIPADPPLAMAGGEYLSVPRDLLPGLAREIEGFWSWLLGTGTATHGTLFTEEHILSVVLGLGRLPCRWRDDVVKRIRTDPQDSSVDGHEAAIPLWHLPSEQRRGLRRVYEHWNAHSRFGPMGQDAFGRMLRRCLPAVTEGRPPRRGRVLGALARAARVLLQGR
jgi:hypothetical protein